VFEHRNSEYEFLRRSLQSKRSKDNNSTKQLVSCVLCDKGLDNHNLLVLTWRKMAIIN
jgi:hypothetical protein